MKFRLLRLIYCFTFAFILRFTEASKANPPSLSRGVTNGVAYANFVAHKFHYLNITILGAAPVSKGSECGLACVNTRPCFSFNLAAFPDINGRLLCEMLPSDKYNNSEKFVSSQIFHHFSIWSGCSSGPCQNSGTCVSTYEQNTYTCVCAAGYTGKNCETVPHECRDGNYVNLTESNRRLTAGGGSNCDNQLNGWYRFSGNAGTKMLDVDPGGYDRCGTSFPGYLTTPHPSPQIGIFFRRVCFYGSSSACCTDIKVRNCVEFFVYELKAFDSAGCCHARYCSSD